MSAHSHAPTADPPDRPTDDAARPTLIGTTGVTLDLPERRTPVARYLVAVVAALLGALLVAATVVALANSPFGAVLLAATLFVAPFVLVAMVVDGVAAAAERADASRA